MMSIASPSITPLTLRRPVGASRLPVYEADKARLLSRGRRISQWYDADLSLRAWQFYHAAAKTELARNLPATSLAVHAHCFYGLTADLLVWQSANLRIRDEGILSRKDASRTYYAGRFGEAVTYLFMMERGYTYWDHLPSLISRLSHRHEEQVKIARVVYRRKTDLPVEQPDFIFEKDDRTNALAESKGSFVRPGVRRPPIKSYLSKALGQLDRWRSIVRPQPESSFAIGTFLREESDSEDSLIVFADPEEPIEWEDSPLDIPSDAVLRGNYAAWLGGMGLPDAALALRNRTEVQGRPVILPVITIGETQFALTYLGTFPGRRRGQSQEWVFDFFELFYEPSLLFMADVSTIGIELTRLRKIESAVRDSQGQDLLEIRGMEPPHPSQFPEWFSGSILPDGTLYGILHLERPTRPPVRHEDFRL